MTIGTLVYGDASRPYGAGPHAVRSAAGLLWEYDANGNAVCARAATGDCAKRFDYGVHNVPARVTSGGVATDFVQDERGRRFYRLARAGDVNGPVLSQTFHVGETFFEEEWVEGVAAWRHYVHTPEGVVAIAKRFSSQPAWDWRFWHRDHLGSPVRETYWDGSGAEAASWDAWGKRRLADAADGTPANLGALTGPRGFTGHEHLDGHGLIHMNGRMYEPALGRFLNADPLVQAPLDARSWNRYSYVMNNPLAYTDPTGYSWWTKWRRPIFAIAASFLIGPEAFNWAMGNLVNSFGGAMAINGSQFAIAQVGANAFAGAASGFAAGGIMGGNLNSALQGAVSGSLSGGTAGYFGDNYSLTRVAAESVVGGASSAISGGSFRDGFKVSGILSALTYASVEMRDLELEHSRRSPGQVGDDPGIRGRTGKLAGNRIVAEDLERIRKDNPWMTLEQAIQAYRETSPPSLMGCHQGGSGCFFGIPYPSNRIGEAMRFVNESFAGAHDLFSHPVHYRSDGMAHAYSGIAGVLGEGYSAIALIPAAPFAAASMIPDSARWVPTRAVRERP